MKRLIDVEGTLVHQLLERLEAASIKASAFPVTTYRGSPHPSGLFTVSVPDDCSLEGARNVVAEYLAHIEATRTEAVCQNCGYDLGGHHGLDRCPECGEVITAPAANITCRNCGEDVPSTFGVCWHCGADMNPGAEPGDT